MPVGSATTSSASQIDSCPLQRISFTVNMRTSPSCYARCRRARVDVGGAELREKLGNILKFQWAGGGAECMARACPERGEMRYLREPGERRGIT
jgi:hypothetical protein